VLNLLQTFAQTFQKKMKSEFRSINFDHSQFIVHPNCISINGPATHTNGSTFNLKEFLPGIEWDGVWTYLRPGVSNTVFTAKGKRKAGKLRNLAETMIAMGARQVDQF